MRFFCQKFSMGLSKQRLRLNCIPLITLNILHRTSLAMKVLGKCTRGETTGPKFDGISGVFPR